MPVAQSLTTTLNALDSKLDVTDCITFASHFLMNGVTLEELQELMAHSDITTTKRYAHITAEHKRKVLLQMTGLIKSDSESHVSSCQLEAHSE